VPMTDFCRVACDRLSGEQLIQLKTFHSHVEKMGKGK